MHTVVNNAPTNPFRVQSINRHFKSISFLRINFRSNSHCAVHAIKLLIISLRFTENVEHNELESSVAMFRWQ